MGRQGQEELGPDLHLRWHVAVSSEATAGLRPRQHGRDDIGAIPDGKLAGMVEDDRADLRPALCRQISENPQHPLQVVRVGPALAVQERTQQPQPGKCSSCSVPLRQIWIQLAPGHCRGDDGGPVLSSQFECYLLDFVASPSPRHPASSARPHHPIARPGHKWRSDTTSTRTGRPLATASTLRRQTILKPQHTPQPAHSHQAAPRPPL